MVKLAQIVSPSGTSIASSVTTTREARCCAGLSRKTKASVISIACLCGAVILEQISNRRFLVWESSSRSMSIVPRRNALEGTTTIINGGDYANVSTDTALLGSPRASEDILELLGIHPRAFEMWNPGQPLPCLPLEENWDRGFVQRSPSKEGILFVKVPKAASTTASSVTLRIASRQAAKQRLNQTDDGLPLLCRNRVQHSKTHQMKYNLRNRSKSFLWSLIRSSTKRAVSQFFHFHVSRREKNATDIEEFHKFFTLGVEMLTNFQLKYLSLWPYFPDKTDPVRLINRVLSSYDFIGIMERTDESVVALQMLLGLDTEDVLFISSKSSGGYDDGRYKDRCVYIQPSVVTPPMTEYFDSPVWRQMVYWDDILHKAVNRSLDMTIEKLGRATFEETLLKFRRAKEKVTEQCLPTIRFPCSKDGMRRQEEETDCLYDDMGCGFECMDKVMNVSSIS